MASRFRVTYATLSADNEDLHAWYEEGLETARGWFGRHITPFVNGEERPGGETFEVRSPVDTSVTLCTVASATTQDVADAVAAAKAARSSWGNTDWRERVRILRAAAELISDRCAEFAAVMTMEVGKNRLEALGDVEEAADLIRYYCTQMEQNNGFAKDMDKLLEKESTRSVMRPYGVWGVIVPFNYPMALAAGPAGGALVAGNTVVLKPAPQGTFSSALFTDCLREAGVPADAFHMVPGGDEIGQALVADPDVDGITFTGSYAVGMSIYHQFGKDYPKPVICEMGGKNPTIVTAKADLDLAAQGITRSAFSFSGQKCSANSRVYVEREVYDELLGKIVERAKSLVLDDPTKRDTFLGPVIEEESVRRYEKSVAHAKESGTVVLGGEVLGATPDGAQGYYVAPTIVTDLPLDDKLFRDELFLPFLAIAPVDSLEQGLELANDSDLGLTAGFFSSDETEIQQFFDGIEAGVVYVNRPAGATTGAWPGVQPFGGWKGSGTYGNAGGGLYYVQQFMREQSRTVVA